MESTLAASSSPIGCRPDYTTALTDKRLVTAGQMNLYRIVFENKTGATIYIQFHNAKQTSDVTLGTTQEIFSYPVPANGFADEDIGGLPMANFPLGLVIAATTTPHGSTLVGTGGLSLLFWR